jgi:hypothetical protein
MTTVFIPGAGPPPQRIMMESFILFELIFMSFPICKYSDFLWKKAKKSGVSVDKTVAARGLVNGRGPQVADLWEGWRSEAPEVLGTDTPDFFYSPIFRIFARYYAHAYIWIKFRQRNGSWN